MAETTGTIGPIGQPIGDVVKALKAAYGEDWSFDIVSHMALAGRVARAPARFLRRGQCQQVRDGLRRAGFAGVAHEFLERPGQDLR